MKSIKISNIFLLLALTTFLFACKKEDAKPATPATDPRDAFVGTWKGNLLAIIDGETLSEQNTIIISKNLSNSTKIVVNVDGEPYGATVNSNTFTYDQYTTDIDDGDGGVIRSTISGTATINGSSLTENGSISIVSNNEPINGTWTRNSVKQ